MGAFQRGLRRCKIGACGLKALGQGVAFQNGCRKPRIEIIAGIPGGCQNGEGIFGALPLFLQGKCHGAQLCICRAQPLLQSARGFGLGKTGGLLL